jgi:hypothetical protein
MSLSNEQSRQLIDVGHVYAGLRAARREKLEAYRYAMRWRTISGRDYLYCGDKSLGARSQELETAFSNYTQRRRELETRIEKLDARLAEMAPVNRALRLGRVPKLPARILRALDAEGLIGRQLRVIGTHALYAYEAAAGEYFAAELLATSDLDLCWDAKTRLTIIADGAERETVLSVLKRVDRSFETGSLYGISARNDEGFIVEIMSPEAELTSTASGIAGDLAALPVPEIAELLADEPFSAMAMGEDGLPVQIVCPQPAAFMVHKRAIAKETSGRPALQRRRDAAQADALVRLAPVLEAAKGLYREPV